MHGFRFVLCRLPGTAFFCGISADKQHTFYLRKILQPVTSQCVNALARFLLVSIAKHYICAFTLAAFSKEKVSDFALAAGSLVG